MYTVRAVKLECKCMNCEERFPGCHDHCDSYKEWRKKYDERVNEIYQNKIEYLGGEEMTVRSFVRHKTTRKRRKANR